MGITKFLILLLTELVASHGFNTMFKEDGVLTENLLRDVVDKMGHDKAAAYFDVSELDTILSLMDKEFESNQVGMPFDYPELRDSGRLPNLRDQEYLQQNSLLEHQCVPGEACDGKKLLKLEDLKNQNVIKTDATLPAYCNPPNPCPVQYTAEDGCLEDFDNSAGYSRIYQSAQDCMCDADHMFECPPNPLPPQHNVLESSPFMRGDENSYHQSDMLPIAAKKGNNVFKVGALE